MKSASLLLVASLATATACQASPPRDRARTNEPDSLRLNIAEAPPDSLDDVMPERFARLTEADYEEVARELGIEVAAMKAVTDIEAGRTHEGFSRPGVPLVNFDMTMFRKFARINGINLERYRKSHPAAFSRQGSGQAAVNRRLDAAMHIDRRTAIQGTFWGMFQIGGFNYKKCGCETIDEFYERMSRSERDQLELFAKFITSTGLVKHLKTKNWAAFARGYNGPGYAARGYHTKMAAAYARYSKK